LSLQRGTKTQQPLKETLFIKSDFFDQKVPVLIHPPVPGSSLSMSVKSPGQEKSNTKKLGLFLEGQDKAVSSLTI
jgi:hypothetical protein